MTDRPNTFPARAKYVIVILTIAVIAVASYAALYASGAPGGDSRTVTTTVVSTGSGIGGSIASHTSPDVSTMTTTSLGTTTITSLSTSISSTTVTVTSTTTLTPLQLLVPLYIDPTSTDAWSQLESVASSNPKVQINVIINPNNGPGQAQQQSYVNGVNQMKAAGVTVLGYVYTNYGSRDASSVVADMKLYKTWYNVTGIFIDEMSDNPSTANYYSNLTSQAHGLGLDPVIGNPGVEINDSLVASVDNAVIYESNGLPQTSSVCESGSQVPSRSFSIIASGVPSMPSVSYLSSIRNCIGLVYFTDQTGNSNLYNQLPSYFSSEVSEVLSLNENVSG